MNGVNGTNGVTGKTDVERNAQRSYWTEHSVETTVEAMMLDSQAKIIDKEERPEVGLCPQELDRPYLLVVTHLLLLITPPHPL